MLLITYNVNCTYIRYVKYTVQNIHIIILFAQSTYNSPFSARGTYGYHINAVSKYSKQLHRELIGIRTILIVGKLYVRSRYKVWFIARLNVIWIHIFHLGIRYRKKEGGRGNYENVAIFTFREKMHIILEETREYILLRARGKLLNWTLCIVHRGISILRYRRTCPRGFQRGKIYK